MGYVVDARAALWLAGSGRLTFLHRLSTASVAELGPGQGTATILLTDAGRVVDVLSVYEGSEGSEGALVITTGRGAAAAAADHLRRYILYHDDVRVTDATSQVAVFTAPGAAAAAAAWKSLGTGDAQPAPGRWIAAETDGHLRWIVTHPTPGGLGGLDVVVPRDNASAVHAGLESGGLSPLTDAEYAAIRISSEWPSFGAEITEALAPNPLELGLKSLIDFAKGCYTGQEIVARLDTYDRVQRRLVLVSSEARLEPGMALCRVSGSARGKYVSGVVTSAAQAGGRWRALALVPRSLDSGELAVDTGGGTPGAPVRREQPGG